jgi:ABC-type transport system involved in multi-copper enzyme maturation permease subunit
MASAHRRLDAFVQRTLAWWTNASAWPERLVVVAFVVIAAMLVWLTAAWLSSWPALALWVVFGIVVAFASRQGWLKLLGPVLFYDMIRTARRSRYSIMRIFYGCALLFILAYMFLMLFLQTQIQNRQMERREFAMVAEGFFFGFILIQMVLVIVLTPAYVAGAIAEEKDRKTMEFMLATDLANREIVLSKLLSRLANLTLLLLTGLPVLSILQFIGGVDQELMLAGFAWIGLTMLGLASVSILFSTVFQKPRDAISLTYLLAFAYAALATFGFVMSRTNHPFMSLPLWFGDDPPTPRSLLTAINGGNPVAVLIEVTMAMNGVSMRGARTTLAAEIAPILARYAWFHLGVSAVAILWSILRLRAIALKQTVGGTTAKLRWWQRLRPTVGQFPMLWKEIFVEGRMKFNWLVWIPIIVLVALTLGFGLWILGEHLYHEIVGDRGRGVFGRFDRGNPWERLRENMNVWFRIAGTGVACLLILMVGVRASTSITNEREKDTLDALIASPLSGASMLFAKLVGNLLSVRLGLVWFGSMLLLALFTGGIHPLGVPIVVIGCVVYAVAITMIGLFYSMTCKTSLQSAVFTVLTSLFFGGAHWLITTCFCMPAFGLMMMAIGMNAPGDRVMMEAMSRIGLYFIMFQTGITPPAVLGFCSFSWREMDFDRRMDREYWEFVGFCVVGLFLWLIAAGVLWFAILVPTFRRLMRREELVKD